MLSHLYIRNYALIDELDLQLGDQFNIITGETGAGKSIILGALGLILGNRADSKTLNHANGKCIIEGTFSVPENFKAFFDQHELDFDAENLLRREIAPSGKSRAFVNDTPVSLQVLKEIGEKLVDIHSQHSNLLLNNSSFRLDVVDAFAKNDSARSNHSKAFAEWAEAQKKYASFLEESQALQKDLDYLKFQLNEIESLRLESGEYARNEKELSLLSNVEKLMEATGKGRSILDEGDFSVIEQLSDLKADVQVVARVNESMLTLSERLNSSLLELRDIYQEFVGLSTDIQEDPERLDELNERQQLLQRLFRKYNTEHEDALLTMASDLADKVRKAEFSDEDTVHWKKEVERLEEVVVEAGSKLTTTRVTAANEVNEAVTILLRELGMPDAIFKIDFEQLPIELAGANGFDKTRFLFSSNKGNNPQSVSQVASGGEISRIMLALKYLLAGSSRFPTLIFDEIDLGISGEVAIKMGSLLNKLSRQHQIVSITHLPQIAAMGTTHFKVSKTSDQNRSYSHITRLGEGERIQEISQMIAGASAGENAVESAKELLQKFAALN